MKPTFSTSQIVQQLRTSWDAPYDGTTASWSTASIPYYIGGASYPGVGTEADGVTAMTPLMQARAALAFELWDDLIARNLDPSGTAAFNQMQFEYSNSTESGNTYTHTWLTGGATGPYGTPAFTINRADIWLNSSTSTQDADNDMYLGGRGFETYLHEIGHGLGLSHPGNYNLNATYAGNAEYDTDNRQYTVMSYFGGYAPGSGWQQDGSLASWLYSSTPMIDDIAAIQAVYGADMTTRTGDTTYGFNSNAGREVFDFSVNPTSIFAIWDAGGNDTLDVSGFSASQRIDLHAGAYSSIGGMTNNVAIAYGATIENAIGGSGADTIIGNDGANTIRGGGGNDTIDGAGGFDTAVFSGARASYLIHGHTVSGPDGSDTLNNVERLSFSDQSFDWTPASLPVSHDFNGDGFGDFLWQNVDGTPAVWMLSGTSLISGSNVGFNPGAAWHLKDSGDFNGDGKADILWQNADGTPAVWLLNGSSLLAGSNVGFNPGAAWQVQGAGDFNGDHKADILWQNTDGTPSVWLMDGLNLSSGASTFNPGAAWHVRAIADFNGDGKADIALQNADGTPAIWQMDGTSIAYGSNVGFNPGSAWKIQGAGDFNGDGKADLLWQHTDGTVAIWMMDGNSLISGASIGNLGASWHVLGANDFNGDGKADIEWQNDNGSPRVWLMDGYTDIGDAVPGFNPGASWHLITEQHTLV
jgi:hypothetical protein